MGHNVHLILSCALSKQLCEWRKIWYGISGTRRVLLI